MKVMVEHPIEEAEAMVERLGCCSHLMTNPDLAEKGKQRLEQAIRVERGAGGVAEIPPTVKDRAEALIGQSVRVYCKDGTSDCGTMVEGTPAVLYIHIGSQKVRGIPYERVSRIESVAGAAA